MLQQTQVVRVAERFEPFLRQFPTPRSLAASTERAVLVAWQGMGYYRRARLLREAAIEISKLHGGRVPRTAAALRELPGVGRYTAGAIASIAFGAREPIVDGNVARVILRVRGIELPLRDREANEHCWRDADALVQAAQNPAALNEGLMELGATVCTPLRPKCTVCPIRAACRAYLEDSVDRIPAPPRGKPPRRVRVNTLVVHDAARDRVLLVQRPDDGMWGAMWETPEVPITSSTARVRCGASPEAPRVRNGALQGASRMREAGSFRHLTTHRDLHIRVLFETLEGSAQHTATRVVPVGVPVRWVARSRIATYPISNATRRVLAMALDNLTASKRSAGAPKR